MQHCEGRVFNRASLVQELNKAVGELLHGTAAVQRLDKACTAQHSSTYIIAIHTLYHPDRATSYQNTTVSSTDHLHCVEHLM